MDFLTTVVIYIVVVCALAYILMFGESSTGCIGKLHYFITQLPCKYCRMLLMKVLSEKWLRRIDSIEEYCCWSPNPILQTFFLGLVFGGFYIFYTQAWSYCGNGVSWWHKPGAFISIGSLFAVYCLACYSDAGQITAENVDVYLKVYEYDYVMFEPTECRTTKLQKPARSKYCRIMKGLYARYDHYCPWLSNCVAEKNIRWFMLFLFGTGALCEYCAVVTFYIVLYEIEKQELLTGWFLIEGEPRQLTYAQIFQVNLVQRTLLTSLGIFCLIIGFVVWGFGSYHFWHAARGSTTNERFKLSDLREDWYEMGEPWKTNKFGVELNPNSKIRNFYNEGMLSNLQLVFFPASYHRRKVDAHIKKVSKDTTSSAPAKGQAKGKKKKKA